MLVIVLFATTGRKVPDYGQVVTSAATFQQYFRDLRQANTMSPIERFVFSLVLSKAQTPKANAVNSDAPAGRT